MKKINFALITMLCFTAITAQQSPLFKYIPREAATIWSFNPLKLAGKIPGDTFRASSMYSELMKKDDADLKRFLADPSISGIDFANDLWVTTNGANNKAPTSVNIFGVLKDEAQFASMINKIKDNKTVHRYGTNRVIISDDGSSVAWNDEIFVISAGKNRKKEEVVLDFPESDTSNEASFAYMEKVRDQHFKSARENCFELLTPKSVHVLLNTPDFTSLMSGPGDIKMWSDGTPNKMLEGIHPMAGMLSKFSKMTGDNKSTVINFDNGKISVATSSYLDGSAADLYRKYPSAPLPVALASRLPQGKLLGLVLSSINTDLLKDMMRQSGLDLDADSIKSKIPFDLSLLTAALKNQAMLAVLKSDNDGAEKTPLKGIELIIAVPVADKAKFEELKTAFTKLLKEQEESGKGEKFMKDFKPAIRYNDQFAVLAMTEKAAFDFLNNPGTAAAPAWLQAYQQFPMVMNVDIREVINLVFSKTKEGSGGKEDQMKTMLGLFDRLTITGGDFQNNALHGTMELSFSNQQENSMLQLFRLMNLVIAESEKNKQERRMEREDVEVETETKQEVLESPPPPPPVKPKKKG